MVQVCVSRANPQTVLPNPTGTDWPQLSALDEHTGHLQQASSLSYHQDVVLRRWRYFRLFCVCICFQQWKQPSHQLVEREWWIGSATALCMDYSNGVINHLCPLKHYDNTVKASPVVVVSVLKVAMLFINGLQDQMISQRNSYSFFCSIHVVFW